MSTLSEKLKLVEYQAKALKLRDLAKKLNVEVMIPSKETFNVVKKDYALDLMDEVESLLKSEAKRQTKRKEEKYKLKASRELK